jgi:UDP:flavonoid glycosyltransferase YjiC (YdhE family)
VPVFADQFANAPKVAQAGAGIQVHTGQDSLGRRRPVGREDILRIRTAIETVLADGSYREAARAVAADMAAAPAIGTLLGQLPRQP